MAPLLGSVVNVEEEELPELANRFLICARGGKGDRVHTCERAVGQRLAAQHELREVAPHRVDKAAKQAGDGVLVNLLYLVGGLAGGGRRGPAKG